MLRNTTGLLVVHRPSTVALADRVALLHDGVLVAVGTHHELMERPDYASVLSVDYDGSRAASVSTVRGVARYRCRGGRGSPAGVDGAAAGGAPATCSRHWRRLTGGRSSGWRRPSSSPTSPAQLFPTSSGSGSTEGVAGVRHDDYVPIGVITGLIVGLRRQCRRSLYRVFVAGSGRIGQEILLELRERVFAHFQRLSLAFHERYTTGRMISRLTSDLEAINDMFTLGLDTLINAVLSVVSVGVILLVLDLPARPRLPVGLHPALVPDSLVPA